MAKFNAKCRLMALNVETGKAIDITEFDSITVEIEAPTQDAANEIWAKRNLYHAMAIGAEKVRKELVKGGLASNTVY